MITVTILAYLIVLTSFYTKKGGICEGIYILSFYTKKGGICDSNIVSSRGICDSNIVSSRGICDSNIVSSRGICDGILIASVDRLFVINISYQQDGYLFKLISSVALRGLH